MATEMQGLEAAAANTVIGNRVVFAETMGHGRTARERQADSPAALEIAALAQEIKTTI